MIWIKNAQMEQEKALTPEGETAFPEAAAPRGQSIWKRIAEAIKRRPEMEQSQGG